MTKIVTVTADIAAFCCAVLLLLDILNVVEF